MATEEKPDTKRPPKLDLPFGKRSSDPGEWAYDHRIGLCVTVIAYLLAGIVFVSAKLVVGGKKPIEYVYINFEEPRQAVQPLERIPQQSDDFSQIRNLLSNENASRDESSGGGRQSLNAALRDDRGTRAGDIYDEAAAVQQRAAANRRAYEAGLREESEMGQRRPQSSVDGARSSSGDTRSQGRVTVSFSLANPVRYSDDLFIPAYLCEAGGEIIISITVNRNGDVVAAIPLRASSSVDECIRTTAVSAALRSRFNVDSRAPEKQQGTITYIFMPQ